MHVLQVLVCAMIRVCMHIGYNHAMTDTAKPMYSKSAGCFRTYLCLPQFVKYELQLLLYDYRVSL